MINNIVGEVFLFNIYAYYLPTNRSTLVVFIAQTVYALHDSKYIAICSIDVMVDNFNRFELFCFFYFEVDNFPSRTLLLSSQKFLFAISSPFRLNFFLVFKLIVILFGVKTLWYFYYGKCSLAVWLCQIVCVLCVIL